MRGGEIGLRQEEEEEEEEKKEEEEEVEEEKGRPAVNAANATAALRVSMDIKQCLSNSLILLFLNKA
jgi:CO dehydrogenase/acetyl-CoA synthase beta subunit